MAGKYDEAVDAVMGELYSTLKSRVISEIGVSKPSPELVADLTMKALVSVQLHMLNETLDDRGTGMVQMLDLIQSK